MAVPQVQDYHLNFYCPVMKVCVWIIKPGGWAVLQTEGVLVLTFWVLVVLCVHGAMSMSDDSHVVLGVVLRRWMCG